MVLCHAAPATIVFTSLMGVRDGATASLNLKHVVTIKHNSAISPWRQWKRARTR